MRPEEKAANDWWELFKTNGCSVNRLKRSIARCNAEHYLPLLKRACMELCGPRFGDCKVKNLSDCFLLEEIAALEAAKEGD